MILLHEGKTMANLRSDSAEAIIMIITALIVHSSV